VRTVESPWSIRGRRVGRRQAAVLGLFAAVICAACGSLPRTYYYTLPQPPPPPANDLKTNLVLGVERLRAAEVLRDDRIVFYESPTQLNFYQYHRWSSDPAAMVSELVVRKLSQMAIFAEVRRVPSRDPVDYVLKGQLLNFEEVDDGTGVKGRVGLELTLVRSRDHKAVWSDTRRVERAAQGKGVPGVVSALNAASEQLLGEALAGLAAQVEREFAQQSEKSQ